MTTGAIYGNFKNRDELFIALGHAYWAPVIPQIAPGAAFAEAMQALASATLAASDERAPAAIGRLTGLAYTLRSAELRARVQQVMKDAMHWAPSGWAPSTRVSCRCGPSIWLWCFTR
jgi:hypothetical protein